MKDIIVDTKCVDQELISYRYSSCSSSCSCRGDFFKTAWSSVVLDPIRMKFGTNVAEANTHRLTESDFRSDVTLSRRRLWRHFTHQSAATWWVNTKRLPALMQKRSAISTLFGFKLKCRRQSVSCRSRSSVEQSSITRHCCLPSLSPSSAVVLNHISSHFLIRFLTPLSFVQCPCSNSSFWTL